MVEYKDRLREAMRISGVDEHALAQALDISYQAVKKALKGGDQGTSAMTARNNSVAAKFMRVNPDWLATGEGRPDVVPVPLSTLEVALVDDLRAIERANPQTFQRLCSELKRMGDGARATESFLRENHGVTSYVTPERAEETLGLPAAAEPPPKEARDLTGISGFGDFDDAPAPVNARPGSTAPSGYAGPTLAAESPQQAGRDPLFKSKKGGAIVLSSGKKNPPARKSDKKEGRS